MSRKFHNKSFVADLHCDTVLWMRIGRDISRRCAEGHIDIPRLIEGGVNLQLFACYLSPALSEPAAFAKANELIDTIEKFTDEHPNLVRLCYNYDDAISAFNEGKIGMMTAIENGSAIQNNLDNVEHFHRRGMRYMTLTHTASTDWCISANDKEPKFNGLTDFGGSVIERMDELGVIVDVSHIAPIAVDEVLEVSSQPIIASHSNARVLCNHIRNLSDRHIKAVADSGGMIGVNFCRDFLSRKAADYSEAFLAKNPEAWELYEEIDSYHMSSDEYRAIDAKLKPYFRQAEIEYNKAPVTIDDVADHIEYVIKVGGEDHVGIGSDYDGILYPPEGLSDISGMPNITDTLLKRGHSENRVEKILGKNFLRVLKDVCG